MGIPGARSILDEDQRRFGAPWRVNWGDDEKRVADAPGSREVVETTKDDSKKEPENKPKANEEENGIDDKVKKGLQEANILLVDGMALLYHVAVHKRTASLPAVSIHTSPSTVKDLVSAYLSSILRALPEYSEVRVFMDGLAPAFKINAQLERLKNQAIAGDVAARKEKDSNVTWSAPPKLLDPLSEWAFVEAIEEVSAILKVSGSSKFLELHRPSRGEAEAYIDYWISRKIPKGITKVFILADDTDFLVYQHCPGFIPLQTLEIEEDSKGVVRLSGFQYERQKFLDAFLPSLGKINPDDVMPVVAALAGCDYTLPNNLQNGLESARTTIVKSDIGGLREKARNNPSKAQQLTAILRYMEHFLKKDNENWADAMCDAASKTEKMNGSNGNKNVEIDQDPNTKNAAAEILKEAFLFMRKIYFRTLALPENPSFEKKPTSVEIRRLLEYGIFYCRPIIETWDPSSYHPLSRKRTLGAIDGDPMDTSTFALVITPPFTRQVAAWVEGETLWRMPHFYQARLRLHCLLVQFACTGGSYAFEGQPLRLSPMWTNEYPRVTEYNRSHNVGGHNAKGEPPLRILEKALETPIHDNVSAGWQDEADLLSGEGAVDRAILFCILGNIRQAKPALNPRLKDQGSVFLTSLFLPYNLAFVIILMGTSPGLESINLMNVRPAIRAEMDRVWPFITLCCYHGIFISNALLSLFGSHTEEQKRSNLSSPGKIASTRGPTRVSDTMRYNDAVWIWSHVREGADMELLRSSDSDDAVEIAYAVDYLDAGMAKLRAVLPQTDEWDIKAQEWRDRAKVLWIIYFETFNVALTTESSARMDDW